MNTSAAARKPRLTQGTQSVASRKPGPICATQDAPFDEGTRCLHQSPVPGPTGGPTSTEATHLAELKTRKASTRLAENKTYLANKNVAAFIAAIAVAEGGDYNLKFGGVKGRKNDKWQFTDTTTHPGVGSDGKTTAAGMYQINKATSKEMGEKMGLTDFSAQTQDLLAVEILRSIRVIEYVVLGDLEHTLSAASRRWAALPQGKGLEGRYPGQPFISFEKFEQAYKDAGGQ